MDFGFLTRFTLIAQNKLSEIFRTGHGVVYQCNRNNCFYVEFAGGISAFKMHDFQALKESVEAIDVLEMISNTNRTADVAILMPPRSERCFVLTLAEVISFRELLRGAKAMIRLNSLVHECLPAMAF